MVILFFLNNYVENYEFHFERQIKTTKIILKQRDGFFIFKKF
jgi:hypothetical protein